MTGDCLISVFDKTDLLSFASSLHATGFRIISTGGTASHLSNNNIPVTQVSDVTKFPEVLGGRVKTLHPNIHSGILARADQQDELKSLNINPIQLVVVNLYPFEQTISKSGVTLHEALENIDIGGVTLLRAAAKNFENVIVVVDTKDYGWIAEKLKSKSLTSVTVEERKKLAVKAFQHVVHYDSLIASYLESQVEGNGSKQEPPQTVSRVYHNPMKLKYGVNPHQSPAAIYHIQNNKSSSLPFKVLNGTPGYINLLDAFNAWQLVKELRIAVGLPAAASFKHVSPAGAAVAVPLTAEERDIYEIPHDKNITPVALAYIRARNADPMCSYGDFAAVSDVVDEETALILKTEVSDGIIAPGFHPKALEILKQKKNGAYIVLEMDPNYEAEDFEYREVYGISFMQKRNNALITSKNFTDVVTKAKNLSEDAIRDLIVASITLKYTQSNSVGYAVHGQMIGVGAGQQSRVDCTKLAGTKVENWWLRFHPKVKGLPFVPGTKRVDRTNTRVHYIDNNLSEPDLKLLESPPQPLTLEEKKEWMKKLEGVSLASDAFFPFRDSIDVASKYGVKFISQPGGSVHDESVIQACDHFDMVMANTGVRLFHH